MIDKKTSWEKEKMLVTSIFSISLNVFKRQATNFVRRQVLGFLNPLPNDKILDRSKLTEFADDNFKVDENGRKFSKWIKITVGNGEIARDEQFLLFPQCFQKTCTADT